MDNKKKFFSLIHGETVNIAPNTKVISSDAFSSIIDAQEVLKKVHEDAEKYKIEVAAECEKLKEQAQKEGFEQGYEEWVAKISDLEQEIIKVRKDTEAVTLPIAIKAAKKVIGRELETSRETIIDIISNSLKAVAAHKKIKIYVNKKEFEIVEKHREQLKKIFENLEALSIIPQEDINPGGCIIETEGGIINAQLENQWMILENAFQRLIKIPATKVEPPEKAAAVKQTTHKEPSKGAE